MAERKTLVEGLKTAPVVDPAVEKEFVLTGKAKPHQPAPSQSPAVDVREGKGKEGKAVARVPLTTRIRGDYAAALKRASLQRQLAACSRTPSRTSSKRPWSRGCAPTVT
jgi:hypothetical protein